MIIWNGYGRKLVRLTNDDHAKSEEVDLLSDGDFLHDRRGGNSVCLNHVDVGHGNDVKVNTRKEELSIRRVRFRLVMRCLTS